MDTHEKELTAFERAVLEHLACIQDDLRVLKRHVSPKALPLLTSEQVKAFYNATEFSTPDEPASTQTQE